MRLEWCQWPFKFDLEGQVKFDLCATQNAQKTLRVTRSVTIPPKATVPPHYTVL